MAPLNESDIIQRMSTLEAGQARSADDIHAIRQDQRAIRDTVEEMQKPKWATWFAGLGVAVMLYLAWDSRQVSNWAKLEAAVNRIDAAMTSQSRWMGVVDTNIDSLRERQLQYEALAQRVRALEQARVESK